MSDPSGVPSVLGIEAVERFAPELEIEDARRSAREAEASAAKLARRVQALEQDLAAAQVQAEALSAALTERERSRRTAEQRAHAEQALRRDLARQLSVQSGEGQRARRALGDLAAAEERIREIEAALRDARRRGDEAEQVAAAAAAARARAEHRTAEAEQERARERQPQSGRSEAADDALIVALRRELEVRAGADSALGARLIEAESRLAARGLIERGTGSVLVELRRELDALRAALESERAARTAAEQRAAELWREANALRGRFYDASEAIAGLRGALEALPVSALALEPPAAGERASVTDHEPEAEPEPTAAEEVEPQRFNDARVRLRQAIAPHETDGVLSVYGPPRTTTRLRLTPIFRRLARSNALVREWIKRAQSD